MGEDIPLPFDLPPVARKKVSAAFDGGRITSDGGVMLRLEPSESKQTVAHCDECEAGTGGEVKQPHKQQRIGGAEEQFRNRGAGNKQERRPKRQERPPRRRGGYA
jgi:hypothetical protein